MIAFWLPRRISQLTRSGKGVPCKSIAAIELPRSGAYMRMLRRVSYHSFCADMLWIVVFSNSLHITNVSVARLSVPSIL